MSRRKLNTDAAALDDAAFIPLPVGQRQLRLTRASMLHALAALGIAPRLTATGRKLLTYNELRRVDEYSRGVASS